MEKRVLIFMSNTGGGHRASAEALQAAFRERYAAEFQVEIIDLWMEYAPWPLNQVPKSYGFLAGDAPWLYRGLWNVVNGRMIDRIMNLVARWAAGAMRGVLDTYKPDLIIAVHPLLQQVPLQILARLNRPIHFVTVLTELTVFHPSWFQKQAFLCFVPSEQARAEAMRAGLRPEQIRECGVPLRLDFARPAPPKEAVRHELGLDPDRPAVLLVGGGEGMGPLSAIAQAIAQRLAADGPRSETPAGQLTVICGRSHKLQEELSARPWPVPTRVLGFVSNMADWMAASDCIVTKAGPGTIAEAMARGLPMVLSSYIPIQEAGNVAYVVDHGLGVYAPAPEQIAATVSRWIGPERATLAAMAERARQLARPQASLDIVEEIVRSLSGREA